jgi:glucose dehydrogenase
MKHAVAVSRLSRTPPLVILGFALALGVSLSACSEQEGAGAEADSAVTGSQGMAEGPGTSNGQWQYLGGDSAHTRYSPASQIDASNFDELEEAWVWDGASFGAQSGRSTPSYVNGRLFTVAGPRRYVVAIDPASGELLWSYREPHTARWEYSMRKDYGKGVAYAEVDGRGVIYIISPAFFLTALDAQSGRPLEGFGKPVPVEGFPQTGVRSVRWHSTGEGLHHLIVATDCRKWRSRCRQLRRAGLQPVAYRKHPGRYSRIRRANRRISVEVQCAATPG